MEMIIAVAGSSVLTAVVTGFFASRGKRVDADASFRTDLKDLWISERTGHQECLDRVMQVEEKLFSLQREFADHLKQCSLE